MRLISAITPTVAAAGIRSSQIGARPPRGSRTLPHISR
jgi:hypothetical protein